MKVFGFILASYFFVTSALTAQTIMENPTACFGRDCNPAAAVAANKRVANDCYSIDGYTITYDLGRSGCNNNPFPDSSAISMDFGNAITTREGHSFALYSLEEIRNTVAKFGPKIRMSTTFTGAYEACPSMDTWLDMGLALSDSVYVSCGNNMTTIDFPIPSKVARFQGFFAKDFGSDVQASYTDFDLSRCTSDLILWYSTANICKLEIDLLQLVFEQK